MYSVKEIMRLNPSSHLQLKLDPISNNHHVIHSLSTIKLWLVLVVCSFRLDSPLDNNLPLDCSAFEFIVEAVLHLKSKL